MKSLSSQSLDHHGEFIHLRMDPSHPAEVRDAVEGWVKTLRLGSLGHWNESPGDGLTIWLPTPERLLTEKKSLTPCVLVRPRNRDLLGLTANPLAEEKSQSVVETDDDGSSFRWVLGHLLSEFFFREGRKWNQVARRQQKAFEKEWREALIKLDYDPAFMELFARFLDVQQELLVRPSWESLEKDLETLARRLDKKKNWKLVRPQGQGVAEGKTVFALGDLQGVPLFLEHGTRESGPLGTVAAALLVTSMRRALQRAQDVKLGPGALVEEAFLALPHPMLLLGEKGEVLQHNTAFAKLSLAPSKVSRLAEGEEVQLKGQSWSVRRMGLRSGHSTRVLFSFLPGASDKNRSGLATTELGIITSSIAHELNNPLAGLLTALDLMMMDEWDEEGMQQLGEMKQGAIRCKQLVDTFLGFSRPYTDAPKTAGKDYLRQCLEQALHLQRFRMMESGFRLQVSSKQAHPYAYPLHGPSITMVIYLVLGELMTDVQHYKLLERQTARGTLLEGVLWEDADNFQLRFPAGLPRAVGPAGKLLQFLLQQERLNLTVDTHTLTFQHENVLL